MTLEQPPSAAADDDDDDAEAESRERRRRGRSLRRNTGVAASASEQEEGHKNEMLDLVGRGQRQAQQQTARQVDGEGSARLRDSAGLDKKLALQMLRSALKPTKRKE